MNSVATPTKCAIKLGKVERVILNLIFVVNGITAHEIVYTMIFMDLKQAGYNEDEIIKNLNIPWLRLLKEYRNKKNATNRALKRLIEKGFLRSKYGYIPGQGFKVGYYLTLQGQKLKATYRVIQPQKRYRNLIAHFVGEGEA
jgi:hypothetical protein